MCGQVAASKASGLLAAEAVVQVVALEVSEAVRALPLTWEERAYERGEVAGYRYVVACTDDPTVNQSVFDDGVAANIFVNAVDDPASCSVPLSDTVARWFLHLTLPSWLQSPVPRSIMPVLIAMLTTVCS